MVIITRHLAINMRTFTQHNALTRTLQMPQSVASELGQHSLQKVCPQNRAILKGLIFTPIGITSREKEQRPELPIRGGISKEDNIPLNIVHNNYYQRIIR